LGAVPLPWHAAAAAGLPLTSPLTWRDGRAPALWPDAGARRSSVSATAGRGRRERGRLARRSRRAWRGTAADARTPPHSQRCRQVTAAGEREQRRAGDGWIGAPSPAGMDGLGIFFFYLTGGPNQNRRWIHFGWLRSTECHIVTCLRNVTEAESQAVLDSGSPRGSFHHYSAVNPDR
jgi:hypothetical protein